jgi:N-acetylmuramoyl-L-alanine amidase
MTRRLWIVGTLLILAGCATTSQVIETLPAPIVLTLPPVPVPVAPPVLIRDTQPRVSTPTSRSLEGIVIVVDPGHGGDDDGAFHHQRVRRNTRIPEKEIVLDIGLQVAAMLRDRGATVVMTREGDSYPELEDRVNLAERSNASLFVSIHADSAQRASASGATVHIYESPKTASRQVAASIDAALRRAGVDSRGVRKSNYFVLREHSRPAVLVECGFLSNAGDAQLLNRPDHRTKIADAIADGITRHFQR